jgi:hypothetical protein
MKKPMTAIAATMLSLALAAPAWAGSTAVVDQVGDGTYTLVVQNRAGTRVTTAEVGSVQHYQAKQAEKAAVLATTRAPRPTGVKFSGSRSGCPTGTFVYPDLSGYLMPGQGAGIVQAGANNTAVASQSGFNNRTRIIQQGNNHYAETNQTGNNNSTAVIQSC